MFFGHEKNRFLKKNSFNVELNHIKESLNILKHLHTRLDTC